MAGNSVQQAHDLLMASRPEGASHPADCSLCHEGAADPEKAREGTPVGAEDVKYSEAQVEALVASAVAKETAALQAKIDTLESEKAAAGSQVEQLRDELATSEAEKAELANTVEIAEAEKVTAESARVAVQTEFDTYKNDLAELAAFGTRKVERVEAVKAAAPHLTEAFLGDETRQKRWAEMSEDQFGSLVEGFAESAAAALTPAERELVEKASDKSVALAEVFAKRHNPTEDPKNLRETAAFTGGESGGDSTKSKSNVSNLSNFLRTQSPPAVRRTA